MHESRASWLLGGGQDAAEELLSAVRCYHLAAMNTHQFSPSYFFRFTCYHELGTCLMRLGDLEMAKRAFLWSMTDPYAWMYCRGKVPSEGTLSSSLNSWWDVNQMTEEERRKVTKRSLKDRRTVLKKITTLPSKRICPHCQKQLEVSRHHEKHCARCSTPYCSRECQKSDWPTHKSKCTRALPSPTFVCGACSDSTSELLAAVNWTDMKSTMSLSEASRRVNEWRQIRPEQVEMKVPNWMAAELSE